MYIGGIIRRYTAESGKRIAAFLILCLLLLYDIIISMKTKSKSIFMIVSCLAFAFSIVALRSLNVSADDYGGNDSGLSSTKCSTFRAYTYLCSDNGTVQDNYRIDSFDIGGALLGSGSVPIRVDDDTSHGAGGGGAAWHLYSLDSDKAPHCTGTTAMTCDVTIDTIKEKCADSKYKFYMSYGWEGPRLASNSHSTENGYAVDEPKQYGPVSIGSEGIAYARYNNYAGTAVTDEQLEALSSMFPQINDKVAYMLANARGGELHLSFSGARYVRQELMKQGDYVEGTGFYCVPENKITFKASSKVEWGDGEDQVRSLGTMFSEDKSDGPGSGVIDRTVKEGETVKIQFKQYANTNYKKSNVGFTITRDFKNEDTGKSKGYTIMNSDSIKEGEIVKDFVYEHPTGTYVATDNTVSSRNMVNSNTYKIRFDKAGTYLLCESIKVPTSYDMSSNLSGQPTTLSKAITTKECTRIKVDPEESEIAARSFVRASNGGNVEDVITGIVTSFTEKSTDTLRVEVDDTALVIFTHQPYSTEQRGSIDWTIKNAPKSNSDYQIHRRIINGSPAAANGKMSGSSNLYSWEDGYYTTLDPILDYYVISFSHTGTYNLCETYSVDGTKLTNVCAVIQVGNGTTPPPPPGPSEVEGSCGVGGYTTGVSSYVRNDNTGNEGSLIYVRPTDDVTWHECYYGGVQNMANELVTKTHASHSLYSSDPAPNYNVPISELVSPWQNKYTSIFPSGSNPSTSTGSYATGNAVAVYPTSTMRVLPTYVGGTFNDLIESGTPLAVSTENHGDHDWSCNPGYTDTGGAVYDTRTEKRQNYLCKDKKNGKDCGWVEETVVVPYMWYQSPNCSHGNDYITYNVDDYGPAKASSVVKVPYNYNLSAGVESTNSVIYAGESMTVKGWANVDKRQNNTTGGDEYATIAKNVKTKLIAFVKDEDWTGRGGGIVGSNPDFGAIADGKQYEELESDSGLTLNAMGNFGGENQHYIYGNESTAKEYNAFDASAGDYICFAMAVYPASTGYDTNMGEFDGDRQWKLSSYSCTIVAKKPIFHVYGAGMYSAGDIDANVATKRNLHPDDGYPAYQKSGVANTVIFSPWVEQNLVLKGLTNEVASGASAAGGSRESTAGGFCKSRIPLSFANNSVVGAVCNSASAFGVGKVGDMGGTASATYGVIESRANYVDYWLPAGTSPNIGAGSTIDVRYNYDTLPSPSGESIRYSYSSGDIILNGTTLEPSVTHVVKSNGNVRIDGSIYYASGSYSTSAQVPKLIIYAKNINIDCSVSEIDAILIAEGNIDTCYNYSNVLSSSESSVKLYIRGVTISDKLDMKRTFGAATGKYSDEPAEVVDYDTSLILWGRYMSGAGESGKMVMTYQHELAPRY